MYQGLRGSDMNLIIMCGKMQVDQPIIMKDMLVSGI